MVKKSITVEINQDVTDSLDELSKRTGRKKNLLVGAALNDFLNAPIDKQEETVKKYINTSYDWNILIVFLLGVLVMILTSYFYSDIISIPYVYLNNQF